MRAHKVDNNETDTNLEDLVVDVVERNVTLRLIEELLKLGGGVNENDTVSVEDAAFDFKANVGELGIVDVSRIDERPSGGIGVRGEGGIDGAIPTAVQSGDDRRARCGIAFGHLALDTEDVEEQWNAIVDRIGRQFVRQTRPEIREQRRHRGSSLLLVSGLQTLRPSVRVPCYACNV